MLLPLQMISNPRRLLRFPPVLFDPVEDRIRSRWLAMFAMAAIPAILAVALMVDVWDKSSQRTLDTMAVITTLFQAGDPLYIGRTALPDLAVRLLVTNRRAPSPARSAGHEHGGRACRRGQRQRGVRAVARSAGLTWPRRQERLATVESIDRGGGFGVQLGARGAY